MSNSYFQFKQFRIDQGGAAMKVSTDACIQGAWTPVSSAVKNVLDIGTGTGLLSLMLAQREKDICIDAIELDAAAAAQASENITASPWADRIRLIRGDVRSHVFSEYYDLIICNPPFFNNSLLGAHQERNLARHNLSLSFTELFRVLDISLSPDGYVSIMLPPPEHRQWQRLLEENNWAIFRNLSVRPKPASSVNRIISICRPGKVSVLDAEDLIIYASGSEYTSAFTGLLQDFYLNL